MISTWNDETHILHSIHYKEQHLNHPSRLQNAIFPNRFAIEKYIFVIWNYLCSISSFTFHEPALIYNCCRYAVTLGSTNNETW